MRRYVIIADDGRYFCWGAVCWTSAIELATKFESLAQCPAEIVCGNVFGEYVAVRKPSGSLYRRAKNGSIASERDNHVDAVAVSVEF